MGLVGGEYGTALQAASYSGKLKIVELLLQKKAKPECFNATVKFMDVNPV
jgi:ankyrin repeat protein